MKRWTLMFIVAVWLVCLVCLVISQSFAIEATLEVGQSGYTYTSIQAAINAATNNPNSKFVLNSIFFINPSILRI